ncbi:hypothetical protein G7077_00625 [Sphingomonas piscis]|uniref:Uncharacterized protein n=2 Tax=Sphingomonas piscis TaxID=2714943 RepID=A0A6G7YSY1_9SPHN|nr:hypothetical protein G7077_00625 [Sphingomonas piscis]
MGDGKVYDESTKVNATKGDVVLDGPDGVDLMMTPEAAERTAEELEKGAAAAAGQRRLAKYPHQPK